jgi:hypothetical protein
MKKEFSLSNDKVMINFSAKYCDTIEKLLESDGFRRVLLCYYDKIKNRNSNVYRFLNETLGSVDNEIIVEDLVNLFRLLTVLKAGEIIKLNNKYEDILKDRYEFFEFVEDLYGFWRRLERYSIIETNKITDGLASVSFIEANNKFSKLVLDFYRKVQESVHSSEPSVFRQISAGANAGLILSKTVWPCPYDYEVLEEIPFINTIMLEAPFITYPKKNTRDGFFQETNKNPLLDCYINRDHWFCYPAKVGELLAYIYFHRDLMAHGVTLCNLFEMAREEDYRGKKPDIVYVFGAKDTHENIRTLFYDDVKNGIMLGYVNYGEAIDYFGYMKKMTLTLHNLIMIKRGFLPIHGAMVNVVMKNGKSANVIIMGDSGAGKSESLEAFRSLSEDYISDMTIVFDDMGFIKPTKNSQKPTAFGTEIGAFVRLDDLDQGYAFKEIDRSIFMNPDKTNARLVMPVATYKDIIKGYPIDLFLYANNYDDIKEGETAIEYFNSPEEAIPVFRDGARMAKGTTTEKGLVKSFFANPFGPHQRMEETDNLIDTYFHDFYKTGVKVGQIKTCLGIVGKEKEGPKQAAIELFETIKSF